MPSDTLTAPMVRVQREIRAPGFDGYTVETIGLVNPADLSAAIDARLLELATFCDGQKERIWMDDYLQRRIREFLRAPREPAQDVNLHLKRDDAAGEYRVTPSTSAPAEPGTLDDDGSHGGDPGDVEPIPTQAEQHMAWLRSRAERAEHERDSRAAQQSKENGDG